MRPTQCSVCNNLCINSSESHRVVTCEGCNVKVLRFDEIAIKKSKIDEIIKKIKAIKIGKYEDYVIQIIEQLKNGN